MSTKPSIKSGAGRKASGAKVPRRNQTATAKREIDAAKAKAPPDWAQQTRYIPRYLWDSSR